MHIEVHQRQIAVSAIKSWEHNGIHLVDGEAIRVDMTREEITAKIEAAQKA